MNNEPQLLIDEAYENYRIAFVEGYIHEELDKCLSQEEFIEEIKTDKDFSEKWGLKIEERDLSLLERREIARIKLNRKEWTDVLFLAHYKETYDKYNIPTRIITLSYNNKTATSYE